MCLKKALMGRNKLIHWIDKSTNTEERDLRTEFLYKINKRIQKNYNIRLYFPYLPVEFKACALKRYDTEVFDYSTKHRLSHPYNKRVEPEQDEPERRIRIVK